MSKQQRSSMIALFCLLFYCSVAIFRHDNIIKGPFCNALIYERGTNRHRGITSLTRLLSKISSSDGDDGRGDGMGVLADPAPTDARCFAVDRRNAISTAIKTSSLVSAGVASGSISTAAIERSITRSTLVAAANAATTTSPSIVTLSDGKTQFPLASFGLQIYSDSEAYKLTMTALEVGYRNFFASVLAGNQRGFARAIKDSGIPRNEIFICGSVVSNRVNGYDSAYQLTTSGWKKNMEAFGVGEITYLDQIMLDYPGPDCPSVQGQWAAFEDMYKQGLTKTLAVSNFSPKQLDCLLEKAKVKPVVNQLPYSVAYHPGNSVEENTKRGILVQAWAPLGGSLGGRFNSSIKGVCEKIGKTYNRSWAQVALRWILQTGASFTTQSRTKEHFVEDLNIFDFELSQEEMEMLNQLA